MKGVLFIIHHMVIIKVFDRNVSCHLKVALGIMASEGLSPKEFLFYNSISFLVFQFVTFPERHGSLLIHSAFLVINSRCPRLPGVFKCGSCGFYTVEAFAKD